MDREIKKEKPKKKKHGTGFVILVVLSVLAGIYAYCRVIHDKGNNAATNNIVEMYDVAIPEYDGKAYVAVNNNYPFFTDADKNLNVFEHYSPLDRQGRCGVAYANICPELMPTEERGEIGQIKPSGWEQAKYEGVVDATPPYLYNRCHLIAFCLAGENANEKNLITGTRYMNVEGMLPWEEMVARYVDKTGNHVLYRVTPDFRDEELVARGVMIEAYSVEDNGKGICFCVYCYNVQPGVEIDYNTGKSKFVGAVSLR